jgi:MFS family permease
VALLRAGRPEFALAVVGGAGLIEFGRYWESGTLAAVAILGWSVATGVGLWICGVLFDQIGRKGVRFGKFLLLGPFIGGVMMAVTPLMALGPAAPVDLWRALWFNAFLGIVVGDGVGLGVELAELLPSYRRESA